MMPKIMVRALSGAIYVAIIVAALLLGGFYTSLLALLLAAMAGAEFLRLTRSATNRTEGVQLLDMAGVLCLTAAATGVGLVMWLILMVARVVAELYTRNPKPIRDLSVSVFSQLYIGIPMCILMGAGILDYSWSDSPYNSLGYLYPFLPCTPRGLLHVILAIFVMIWLNDTGAYLVGSACGRTKMFERISPKKTWEGFAGGALFCVGGAVACYFIHISGVMLDCLGWIVLGIVVTVFATWGDLVESLFKRSLAVKDSGHLIPGHGGILDRIDSLLMVLPVSTLYLLIVALAHTYC